MLKVLDGLHHRAAGLIAVITAHKEEEGEWEYPLVDDTMEAVGLWMINEYIQK